MNRPLSCSDLVGGALAAPRCATSAQPTFDPSNLRHSSRCLVVPTEFSGLNFRLLPYARPVRPPLAGGRDEAREFPLRAEIPAEGGAEKARGRAVPGAEAVQ